MDELRDRFQLLIAGDLLLEEIFHRLDVVIGGAFDVFDTLRVFDAEVVDDRVEDVVGVFPQRRNILATIEGYRRPRS